MRLRSQVHWLVLFVLVGLNGCQRSKPAEPIVVHVLYDESGALAKNINRALSDFNLQQQAIADKPILVAWVSGGQYSKFVNDERLLRVIELVVIESGGSGDKTRSLMGELDPTAKLCVANQCRTAGIPRWVSGRERQAAVMLLSFLKTKMQPS